MTDVTPTPSDPPPPYPTAHDFVVSLIRTIVPTLVGSLLGMLASAGLELDGAVVVPAVTGLCIAVYYAAVRWLEQRKPAVGVLLGSTRPPVYAKAGTSAVDA